MNGSGVCYVYPLNTYPSQAPAFNKTIFLIRLPYQPDYFAGRVLCGLRSREGAVCLRLWSLAPELQFSAIRLLAMTSLPPFIQCF